jgi:molybdopterin-binding protein
VQLSGRNQLAATVRSIALGGIMAEVVMELDGGQELVAAITRGSVERMGLQAGQQVVAVVKATEVMVGRA